MNLTKCEIVRFSVKKKYPDRNRLKSDIRRREAGDLVVQDFLKNAYKNYSKTNIQDQKIWPSRKVKLFFSNSSKDIFNLMLSQFFLTLVICEF